MEGTLATIMMFAGNFAPRGWNYCDGSLQSIAEYNALYALIGTTYGGDGQVTFAMPDLRSRVPIGTGQGPGLNNIALGEMAGYENVTLVTSNLPSHDHQVQVTVGATSGSQNSSAPTGVLATVGLALYADPTTVSGHLAGVNANLVGPAGASAPVNLVQPYLAINYVICMEGIFPTPA